MTEGVSGPDKMTSYGETSSVVDQKAVCLGIVVRHLGWGEKKSHKTERLGVESWMKEEKTEGWEICIAMYHRTCLNGQSCFPSS